MQYKLKEYVKKMSFKLSQDVANHATLKNNIVLFIYR